MLGSLCNLTIAMTWKWHVSWKSFKGLDYKTLNLLDY